MYNKLNISIKELCYKGGDRPVLNTVLLEGNRSTATDSHILAQVTTPEVNVEDVPSMLGTISTDHKVLVPYSVICKIEKNLPNKSNLPVLENFYLTSKNGAKEPGWIAMTDLEAPQFLKINPSWSESEYPDTEQLWPKQEPVAKIVLDPLLLEKLCRVAKNFKTSGVQTPVTLTIWSHLKPMMFESRNQETGQELRGIVMPIRDDKVSKWYNDKQELAEKEIPKEED